MVVPYSSLADLVSKMFSFVDGWNLPPPYSAVRISHGTSFIDFISNDAM